MSAVEETLAWEAQWRPRAAASAIVGAVAGLAGGIVLMLTVRSGPDESEGFISVGESLSAAAESREPAQESLLVRQADTLGDNVGLLILATALTTLGALGAIGALTYLFRAARARNPEIGRVVGWSLAAALAIYPIGHAVADVATWISFADFADAENRTAEGARELRREGVIPGALFLETLGALALAIAFVLVSLNAMRVGLLTRFMGILGMFVGALVILPIDQPQLVRAFWLAFLGVLIAGRYPGGAPAAWQTGRAERWPTQQELRERRQAVRAEHRADDEPAPEPDGGDEAYVPGAARRKRKKRRS